MLTRSLKACLATALLVLTAPSLGDEGVHWSPVNEWARLPSSWSFDLVTGVGIDSRGNIYVVHRGAHSILCFDPTGQFIKSIGEDAILASVFYDLRTDPATALGRRYWMHGVSVDASDNLWVTDVGRHIVMKFSPEGSLLLTLGTADQSGETERTFNQPTHAVVGPSGNIYVADGYGNSRIVKFSPDGGFLLSWGQKGSEKGELSTPHALAIDADENIYVADRSNNRIQVFDSEGGFKEEWRNLHSIDALAFSKEGRLFAGAGLDHKILELDSKGKVTEAWGTEAVFDYPHGLGFDLEGNLYIADVDGSRLIKLTRKLDASRTPLLPGSGSIQ